jgi:predicted GNAT superfamily acetyltransferase
MSTEPRIRDFAPDDIEPVWRLNEAAVDAVSSVTRDQMLALVSMSRDVLVIENSDGIIGFCNTFNPGADYGSINYRWFSERYTEFVYLDRIVIGESHRNRGLGALLYGEVERRMQMSGGPGLLTCEVNFDPPNEGSLRFHRRIGFSPVGRQESKPGLVVEMLAKAINYSIG